MQLKRLIKQPTIQTSHDFICVAEVVGRALGRTQLLGEGFDGGTNVDLEINTINLHRRLKILKQPKLTIAITDISSAAVSVPASRLLLLLQPSM